MNVGANIRARREALGLSLASVGLEVGVSEAMMSYIERGQKMPSVRTLADIARVFGCTTDELLSESA